MKSDKEFFQNSLDLFAIHEKSKLEKNQEKTKIIKLITSKTSMAQYSAYDILAGIFAKLPDNYKFAIDGESFARFFYSWKSAGVPVLQELTFDSDGIHLTSRDLQEAFDTFTATGMIASYSPDFNPHIIFSDAMKFGFEKYSKNLFSSEEISYLESLAVEFQRDFPEKRK